MTVSFDKKLAELDAYLQILIEQAETLDKKIESASSDQERDGLKAVRNNLDTLLGSIKHSIVLLQIAKVSIKSPSTDENPYQQTRKQGSMNSNKSTALLTSGSFNGADINPSSTTNTSLNQELSKQLIDQHNRSSPQPPARSFKRQQSQGRASSTRPTPGRITPQRVLGSAQPVTADQRQESRQQSELSVSSQAEQQAEHSDIHRDSRSENEEPCLELSSSSQNIIAQNNGIGTRLNVAGSTLEDGATTHNDLHLHVDENEDDDDDDAFYDAADDNQPPRITRLHSIDKTNTQIDAMASNGQSGNNNNNDSASSPTDYQSIDWDALYDEEEEDLGSLENQGSVIKHLMSQIRIGMDLTKVVLPTFILERRSLLEMYADFFAHPDLFSSIPDYESPEERMIQIVRWYLSAFHAGRKSSVAKKPYNPILGEIFLCHWNLDSENSQNGSRQQRQQEEDQRFERKDSKDSTHSISDIERFSDRLSRNSLVFVAEQVSHHPPVSAFYAENREKRISCCAHIYTKSKYLGLSVGVHNIGHGVINILKHNETYTVTFPSAFGRSILTVPWVELGGNVSIHCKETGYSANIEFLTKPFYGGKKHRVIGEILRPNKEPILTIDGEWNGCMHSKSPLNSVDKEIFVDTASLPVIKKEVRSIGQQETYESRNVWKEVTRALKLHDVTTATAAKSFIEQRQRDLLKDRMEKGIKWKTRYFEPAEDGWAYARTLEGSSIKQG